MADDEQHDRDPFPGWFFLLAFAAAAAPLACAAAAWALLFASCSS